MDDRRPSTILLPGDDDDFDDSVSRPGATARAAALAARTMAAMPLPTTALPDGAGTPQRLPPPQQPLFDRVSPAVVEGDYAATASANSRPLPRSRPQGGHNHDGNSSLSTGSGRRGSHSGDGGDGKQLPGAPLRATDVMSLREATRLIRQGKDPLAVKVPGSGTAGAGDTGGAVTGTGTAARGKPLSSAAIAAAGATAGLPVLSSQQLVRMQPVGIAGGQLVFAAVPFSGAVEPVPDTAAGSVGNALPKQSRRRTASASPKRRSGVTSALVLHQGSEWSAWRVAPSYTWCGSIQTFPTLVTFRCVWPVLVCCLVAEPNSQQVVTKLNDELRYLRGVVKALTKAKSRAHHQQWVECLPETVSAALSKRVSRSMSSPPVPLRRGAGLPRKRKLVSGKRRSKRANPLDSTSKAINAFGFMQVADTGLCVYPGCRLLRPYACVEWSYWTLIRTYRHNANR